MACCLNWEKKEERKYLDIYCRLRPLSHDMESCVEKVDTTTLQIRTRSVKGGYDNRHKFSTVFDEDASQEEVFETVAMPLIFRFLHGELGLLFVYGATGSGKSYTMSGEAMSDPGIIPRTFVVLFSTLGRKLLPPGSFIPDSCNGFKPAPTGWSPSQTAFRENVNTRRGQRLPNIKIILPEDGASYAVFISYIEIYNQRIYDLLENISGEQSRGTGACKQLREDANHQMYVAGATQVEVRSQKEAELLFQKGELRRRQAQTGNQALSSRSHTLLTIRLIKSYMAKNRSKNREFYVTQLCYVDLAGVERHASSKLEGQRLKEAASINTSLLTLRSCLETLREKRWVPYRESKVTHLLQFYFEQGGNIAMMACLNPNKEEYESAVNVIKFAESCNDVTVPVGKPFPETEEVINTKKVLIEKKLRRQDLEDHKFQEAVEELTRKVGHGLTLDVTKKCSEVICNWASAQIGQGEQLLALFGIDKTPPMKGPPRKPRRRSKSVEVAPKTRQLLF